MKIKLKKDNVSQIINYLEGIISDRSINEILSHILIDAEGNNVSLYATNLEIALICNVEAEIEEKGDITILAKKFGDNIRNLSKNSIITISTDENNKIKITSGKGKKLETHGFRKNDVPALPDIQTNYQFVLSQPLLKEMLRKTMFAVLKNPDGKPYFQGVFFKIENNTISVVGSDGHRLSLIRRNIDADIDEGFNVILPFKTVTELFRMLNSTGEVSIIKGEKQILFKFDDILFYSRIIQSNYPDFEKIIPEEVKYRVQINIKKLEESIKWIKPYVDENTNKINFIFTNGKLEINTCSDYGTSEDFIDIDYNGEVVEIPFNIDYITDLIKIIDSEIINVDLINAKSQVLFSADNDDKYKYITMPLRK